MQTLTRPNSPLSSAQWSELEDAARKAHAAIESLSFALLHTMQSAPSDADLFNHITAQLSRIEDARAKILPAYFYHPQGEWLGGESFATREPHFMGMRRLTVLP